MTGQMPGSMKNADKMAGLGQIKLGNGHEGEVLVQKLTPRPQNLSPPPIEKNFLPSWRVMVRQDGEVEPTSLVAGDGANVGYITTVV